MGEASLLDALPAAAFICSAQRELTAANDLFAELLGHAAPQLQGLPLAQLGEATLAGGDAMDAVLAGQLRACSFGMRFLRADQQLVWCAVSMRQVDAGGSAALLALVRDASADQVGEMVLQTVDEGFILLDEQFRILQINAEALRIDGRPREQILGRPHWEVWPGSEDLQIGAAYRKAMTERAHVRIEQVYPHLGQDIWVEARAYPFQDKLAVFYRDITERKRAERALAESEASFRTITKAMPQIVWPTLPNGYHDYFNERWYEYTGWSAGSGDGNAWIGLYHPDDIERTMRRWRYSLDTGEPCEIEYRMRHHSGEYRWNLGRALPLRDHTGAIIRWMGTCTDIHEQVTIKAALQDTQSRLTVALEAAQIGTWRWDIAAGTIRGDRNFTSMLVLPDEETQPFVRMLASLHPDDSAAVKATISSSIATGEPYLQVFRVLRPDGMVRHIQGRATVQLDAGARPVSMSGAVVDITQQVAAEEARRLSESRFRTIVDSDLIGIIEFRHDGTLIKANDAFLKMVGLTREDFDAHGLSWRDATPPEWLPLDWAALESLKLTGIMQPFEKEYFRRDGSRVPVFIGATSFQGTYSEGIAYILDISELKKAQRALEASEQTFRTLADNIPQLAWMAGPDGNIYWYNRSWFDYTGTTLEQVQGYGWESVHHPDHVERVKAHYHQAIVVEQRVWEDTFPLRGANGEYRWFLSRAVPVRDHEGHILRWLGTNTDVTVQREAEEALKNADRRKDDFLALLAHELRNPLAPISTAAQLLKLGAQNPDNIRRSSEIIDRQVKHMRDLVNDIMDVSRVTRGLASVNKEEVDVGSVLDSAIEPTRPLIDSRKHTLHTSMPARGALVLGDRTRLVQVVANLLNNSAKYTPPGGTIRLTAEADAGSVRIAVADNGQGMDENLLPRVFELFAQAERTPDRAEGGLGLGLALVKSIVELHDGTISAHSEGPGTGSSFVMTLPLLRETP
ncbi:PAS domain S-box protein [Massilia sp. AB1]|uniref:PAS domain S-box protein n=1 Tax=Massilia sp. AB1 TaxID=2823371 RepID=UPI001B826212|nr:PAS domain S-box protein [Massilia sp. AB1]MBQ5940625.1 PAS domain S-box protein [Massilia sp. AB1]